MIRKTVTEVMAEFQALSEDERAEMYKNIYAWIEERGWTALEFTAQANLESRARWEALWGSANSNKTTKE